MKKIAILSDVNVDLLQPVLKKVVDGNLYFSGFNQWQSDLLNTESKLHTFHPEIVILLLLNAESNFEIINDIKNSVSSFVQHHPLTKIIVSDFIEQPYSVSTFISENNVESLNKELNDFINENQNIHHLKFSRLIQLYGYKNVFDEKFWYLGKIKLSQSGFKWLSEEISNYLNALHGKIKKVLVLDLDNTLWGDVVGEVGANNIILSDEGKGRIFKDFQRSLLKLKELGVLLTISSKNNLNDVREVFESHADMIIKWDDFVSHQINWKNKSENIIQIASDLNLGTDSFVFIDDSQREREEVSMALPEVSVPEFPTDISLLNFWFINDVIYRYFPKMNLTSEDTSKTVQYIRQNKRNEMQTSMLYDDYIASLQIKAEIRKAEKDDLIRVLQLVNKTNQFNVHPVRLSETELIDKFQNENYRIYILKYADKFGEEGLTACAIFSLQNKNEICFEHFLLSCRILGRKVENLFLHSILDDFKTIEKVFFMYESTEKNNQVLTFLENEGFKQDNQNNFFKYL